MAPDFPPKLVVFDLRSEQGVMEGTLEYVEVFKSGERLRVRWGDDSSLPGFIPIGGGVAHVFQTDQVHILPRGEKVRPDSLGGSRYGWQEGLMPADPWLMFIVILPKGYSLSDPKPMPVSTGDFKGRLAIYWILKGDELGRAKVEWGVREFGGDLASEVEKLNRNFAYAQVPAESSVDVAQKELPRADRPIKILFLAANPIDTPELRLSEEIRAIDDALLRVKFRDRFDIEQQWAVRVSDLQHHLLRHSPDIVHFSGHGSDSSEIILEDNAGNSHPVPARALSQLFSVLKDNIRCVVLNACYSEPQAEAIAQHIDCVVGMSKAIGDEAAIRFAGSFYQALGYGRSVKTAFDLGCLQIDLEGFNEQDTPQLLATKIDPQKITFVT